VVAFPRSGAAGRHCWSENTKYLYKSSITILEMLLDFCFAVPEEEQLTTQFWWLGFRGALKIAISLGFLHTTIMLSGQ